MPKPKLQYWLSDIDVEEVTLCKNPAVPVAAHIVLKSEDAAAGKKVFTIAHTFKSIDKVKKQVFGYALAPDDVDYQGEAVTVDNVEKAAHKFMKNLGEGAVKGGGIGYEHSIFKGVGNPIESAIDRDGVLAKALGFKEGECVPGAWLVGTQCTDETWEKVEKGEITGYSIGGVATRTPAEGAGDEDSLGKKFNGIIGKMLDSLRKQESGPVTFDEAVAESENRQKLWDITDALHTSIYSILDDDAMQKDAKIIALGASIDQFKAAMISFLAVQKAIRDIAGASAAVIGKSETVLAAARDAITTELNKLQGTNKTGQPDNGGNDMELTEVKKAIEDAVTAAVKPLQDEVAALKTDVQGMKDAAAKSQDEASDAKVLDMFKTIGEGLADYKARIEKLENKPTPRQGEGPEGELKKSNETVGAAGRTILG